MTLLILSISLTVIAMIALILAVTHMRIKRDWSIGAYALTPLGGIFMLILLLGMFTKVSANEVGIIYHDKQGVLDTTKAEGFQTKSIFEHITKISTSARTADVKVSGQTKDSIYVDFDITIIYRIESKNAGKFFKVTNKTDITLEQLNSITKASLQSSAIKYDVYSILGSDLENLRIKFKETLETELLEKYHITLVAVSLNDVDAGERIEKIIQNKAEAIQQVEIAEQEKLKAEVEAKTALIKAENDAAVAILLAESKAKAEELLQSVAVNAIKTMYDSQFKTSDDKVAFETSGTGGYLTIEKVGEIVVKQLYYNVWDGKLPTVITDSTGGIIIQP